MKMVLTRIKGHDVYVNYDELTKRELALINKADETIEGLAIKVAENFFERNNTNKDTKMMSINDTITVIYELENYNNKLRLIDLNITDILRY